MKSASFWSLTAVCSWVLSLRYSRWLYYGLFPTTLSHYEMIYAAIFAAITFLWFVDSHFIYHITLRRHYRHDYILQYPVSAAFYFSTAIRCRFMRSLLQDDEASDFISQLWARSTDDRLRASHVPHKISEPTLTATLPTPCHAYRLMSPPCAFEAIYYAATSPQLPHCHGDVAGLLAIQRNGALVTLRHA